MKTAEELHDYIQSTHAGASDGAVVRLLEMADQLNDRCRVLESRLAVAEAKLNAGQGNKLSATPVNQPGSKAWY